MKKGLLSILAGALVVVGCQNYDDQFDSLESQINALASTVAGLSQVQSDLSSLAGTVNSLSSTVASLGSAIDTAVSNGLADITADIAELEAAVANVASSADVTAISEAVTAAQADLTELLANSSVFTGNVTVNSVATLDAFHAMGSSLAIVNGNVDIDVNTDMNIAKVQELVNQFLTITGDLDYKALASTIDEVTFDNLTGVQTLTLEQPGGYVFGKLISAQKISLSDKYKSSVEIIDFRSLTSVASFGTDAYTGGAITFDKATEIHLTSLPYYSGASLSLTGKKGGVIDITALDDVDSTGEQSALALSINGPSSISISKLDGKNGSLTLENVATAVVNDFDGTITVKGGVESFTSNNVVAIGSTSTWADIVTLDIKGVVDPNFVATTATPKDYGPSIQLATKADLETVTLSGTFDSISITGNTNLITATVSADVTGADGIDFDGNTDLETLTLTGSKAAKVQVDDNDSLLALTIDTTIQASSAKSATKDGYISVIGNEDLASLIISSKDISTLYVQTNAALTSIDGAGVTTLGAGGTTASPIYPTVKIYGNDISASLATDKENATSCTKCANLEANDLGAFTTTSKIETLSAYLKLVQANAKSTAQVYFDTVESTVDNTGAETSAEKTGQVDETAILVMDPGVTEVVKGAGGAIYAKKAWLVDLDNNGSRTISVTLNGQDLLVNSSGTYSNTIDISSNQAIALSELMKEATTSRATILGATFNAIKGGNAVLPALTFTSRVSSLSNGENYTNAQAGALINSGVLGVDALLTTWDKVTVTIGGLSVDATITAVTGWATGATARDAIADAVIAAWNGKYGTAGTASWAMSVWGAMAADTNGAIPAMALKSSTAGSRGYANENTIAVKLVATTAAKISATTSGAATQSVLDWTIGADGNSTVDNVATSPDIIITVEGSATNDLSTLVVTDSVADQTHLTTLTTSEYIYTNSGAGTATSTTLNKYPGEARSDVRNAEGASEGTVITAGVAATLKTRVHWLGS